jgi:hypothetical protein
MTAEKRSIRQISGNLQEFQAAVSGLKDAGASSARITRIQCGALPSLIFPTVRRFPQSIEGEWANYDSPFSIDECT